MAGAAGRPRPVRAARGRQLPDVREGSRPALACWRGPARRPPCRPLGVYGAGAALPRDADDIQQAAAAGATAVQPESGVRLPAPELRRVRLVLVGCGDPG